MVPSINRRKRTGVIVWALSSSSDAVRLPRVSAAGPVPADTRTRSLAPAPTRRPPASRARPPAPSPARRPPASRARPPAPAPARRRPVPGPRLRFVPSLEPSSCLQFLSVHCYRAHRGCCTHALSVHCFLAISR